MSCLYQCTIYKDVGRKFSRGGGGANEKKTEKIIRPKNSMFKPLSTIFVPCLKNPGGPQPLPPADAHDHTSTEQIAIFCGI